MATPQRFNSGLFNPSTQGTRATYQTDQQRNTLPPGKSVLSATKIKSQRLSLGSEQFDHQQTTPKVGKAALAVFPAGQEPFAAVSVTAAHPQDIDSQSEKGGCCPNVAQ
jgi:hypothetical protein